MGHLLGFIFENKHFLMASFTADYEYINQSLFLNYSWKILSSIARALKRDNEIDAKFSIQSSKG
jgi:hypothetical protein